MPHNDLKFFTNEPERDLYSRFATILKSNTQFFDVLVGYFRSSGFFKLYKSLENIEKIRILVGLNTDRFTVKLIDRTFQEIDYLTVTAKEGKEIIQEEVKDEFVKVDATSEVAEGVQTFIDWLKSGKMEIRMYTKAPIHAKVYIMRKDQEKVPDMYGSVITGSSNFSQAGLCNNLEFNVELKDAADVDFALERFEDLWKDSVDIKDAYVEAVEQKTWMRNDITPYQIFLKTLYEYFKEEINVDKENINALLPDGYMNLRYQVDAVIQAKKKLEAYNGVFISDVVGLGKTYICALLAASLNKASRKLIICPPVLVDLWNDTVNEFGVTRFTVESLGKLDNLLSKGVDKYDYVFVDEAHRFRNSDTENYTKLHTICLGKKVVLVSATPINNYTSDIENQLYLFQAKQSGTINGIKNIEGFFRGLQSKLNKCPKGSDKYMEQLRENSQIIRDKLIREVMIRRTRTEIKEFYKDDIEKQGLKFPSVGSPERVVYEFDDQIDQVFTETIKIIKDFKYSRYTPLLYLKDQKAYATYIAAQHNMGGFMKGILVKRLESSFYAFRMSLSRFIQSYEKFIEMFKTGKVYISKKVNVYDLIDNDISKLMYYIDEGDVWEFSSKEFSPKFIIDLQSDLAMLNSLKTMWDMIDVDPKLDQFKDTLQNDPVVKKAKKIVFTESKETAEYLFNELNELYGNRIVMFTGGSNNNQKIDIEMSFNPKYKNEGKDKYDLLITTDVLAEGISLHRANVLFNYDLPWNPTRIMQRVGRINRVGTEYDRIYVYNFFPTAQSKAQMPLEERILEKLQGFHDTLGEDYKYLSDAEEVSCQQLFTDLSKNLDDDEDAPNPELKYLAIIREIRDNVPELFKLIKELPIKAKTGKATELVDEDATVSFIRKGALKTFFITKDGTKQLNFLEAIKLIEADETIAKESVGKDYYSHLESNSSAFDDMLVKEEEISIEKPMLTGNDAKVIKFIKSMKSVGTLTDIQEANLDLLVNRGENGEIPSKVSKDIVKKFNNAVKTMTSIDYGELYFTIMQIVPAIYLERTKTEKKANNSEKQVVLSCYLRKVD